MKTERQLLKEYINYVLENHRLTEALEVHDILNPELWDGMELKRDVFDKLLEIAHTFINGLGFPLDVVDIRIVGSNASFNYNNLSDIDLHIITNFELNYVDDAILQRLYNNEKNSFNNRHDITVKGIPVELYIEDMKSMNATNGSYSLLQDKWIKTPQPINYEIPDYHEELNTELKNIDTVLKSNNKETIKNEINKIYMMRKDGLALEGEASIGNLVFKELRNLNAITELTDKFYELESQSLSLESDNILEIKNSLIDLTKNSNNDQLSHIYTNICNLGSYQEDKRKSKKKFILDCIENTYHSNDGSHCQSTERKILEQAIEDGFNFIDEDYDPGYGLSRDELIARIKKLGKNYNFDRFNQKQLYRMYNKFVKSQDSKLDLDLSPEEYEQLMKKAEYDKEHPPIKHKNGVTYIRTDNGGYEILDEADEVTPDTLSKNPVKFITIYDNDRNENTFNNLKELFKYVEQCGGFRSFKGIYWCILSEYNGGEYYYIRDRFAKGGWHWEDCNGYVVGGFTGKSFRSKNLGESDKLYEYNLKDIIDDSKSSDPKRIELAKSIYTEYKGVDSDGTLLFESDSQTRSGVTHRQRIFYEGFFNLLDKVDDNQKITDEDVVNILTGDLMIDCTCESFLYWAWAYKSWKANYGLRKETRAPKRNNTHLNGGACFTGDTLVATDTGFKQIKDIHIGDKVLTHKGRFKPVTHIFEPHNDEIVEVKTNSKSIFCTKDHPFYTTNKEWVEVGNFGKNITTKIKPNSNGKLHFDKKFPFMMGMYLGDGTVIIKDKKIGKYNKSKESCKNPIREGHFISHLSIANNNRLLDKYLSIAKEYGFEWTDQSIKAASQLPEHHKSLNVKNSHDFLHFINEWGGFTCNKLNWEKEIKPEVLERWDDEALKELLKGFYLTDGTCTNYSDKYANIVLYSTNKKMLYQIYLIARKFYNASIANYSRLSTNLKDTPTELYGVKLYGKDAEDFYNYCKTDSQLKTDRVSKFSKRCNKIYDTFYEGNTIKVIETGRIEPVYNIEVEEDNSYCVSTDMIIVHNCKHILSMLELLNRSDSLFDKIAEDLNNLFQEYKKTSGTPAQEPKKEFTPVDNTQFARTAANLARKGKTNKKLHRNPKAAQYDIPTDEQ